MTNVASRGVGDHRGDMSGFVRSGTPVPVNCISPGPPAIEKKGERE